jgi:D-alanyl-D-alanine carboxypeptidase
MLTVKQAIQARGPASNDADLKRWVGPGFTWKNIGKGAVMVNRIWVQNNLVRLDSSLGKGGPGIDLPFFPPNEYTGKAGALWVHRLAAPALIQAWAQTIKDGVADDVLTFAGWWVERHQGWNNARPLSLHTPGLAGDFMARWNPMGRKSLALPPAQFVRRMEENGFHWGGRWTGSSYDPMHFQFTDPLPGVKVPVWQDFAAK